MVSTLLLLAAVLATSTLSGALGMGGGMLLMGVYVFLLPPAEALALHGLTQLAANGWRAWLLRRHVVPGVLLPYLVGAAGAGLLVAALAPPPTRRGILLMLGILPFLSGRLPAAATIAPDRPQAAAGCGFLVGTLHLVAGVSGPVLDVFFLRADLDRRQVVATKALTQALAHAGKAAFFLATLEATARPAPDLVLAAWAAAAAGTTLGRAALERLDEVRFRSLGGLVVRAAGLAYLARGLAAG
jgi:uncharacterized membrane protein YfcA